jgi:polar amino acid transport system substrate-binding protein
MLNKLSKNTILYSLLILFTLQTQAQSNNLDTTKDTLLIGVAGTEPFVFSEINEGVAVEIWDKIADKQSWNYKYVSFNNVEEALESLNNSELDLVVGPISITSKRLETMRFSQPFYNSSISIISRIEDKGLWQKVKPFFSLKLLMAVGIFLIILAIVGALLWLSERKESPDQFPSSPLSGIGNGMWLAIVTMSTTGYGDKAPITLIGRIVAGSWMVISIIFATSMVAGIASTLTLSSLESSTISNIEQLYGRKAATISGSPSEVFLNKSKINEIGVDNLDDAIAELINKKVDAVVYDRPQLLYFLKNNKSENLYISKAEYFKQGYGFAFPLNSQLVLDVNKILLELSENQQIERIIHNYIKKDE